MGIDQYTLQVVFKRSTFSLAAASLQSEKIFSSGIVQVEVVDPSALVIVVV
jgi:hypothetical protein